MRNLKTAVRLWMKICLSIYPCWLFLFAVLILKTHWKFGGWVGSGLPPVDAIDENLLRTIVFGSVLLIPIAFLGGIMGVGILWRISRAFPYRIALFLFLQIAVDLLLCKYDPGYFIAWLVD